MLICEGAGMDYRTLIGEIMSGAIRRYKEREQRKAATDSGAAPAPKTNGALPEEKPALAEGRSGV